jgi:hypothetical protein
VRIECTRGIVVEGKPNDRLSDLNSSGAAKTRSSSVNLMVILPLMIHWLCIMSVLEETTIQLPDYENTMVEASEFCGRKK